MAIIQIVLQLSVPTRKWASHSEILYSSYHSWVCFVIEVFIAFD